MHSTNLEKIYTSPYKSFNFQQLFFCDIFLRNAYFTSYRSSKYTVKSPKFGCFSRSFYCHAFNYSHISLRSFHSHSLFTPLYDGTNEKSLCLMD